MSEELVPTLYCSFCGKHKSEVQKLIAGPTSFICDECIYLCLELVAPEDPLIYPWQDISTAPRNGNKVLLSDGESIGVGFFDDKVVYQYGKEVHRRKEWDILYRITGEHVFTPTHWMMITKPITKGA